MSKFQWLIVGLGNPGSKYHDTRHNVGWRIIDKLFDVFKAEPINIPGVCHYAECNYRKINVVLAKPTTYMNDSGRAVSYLSKKYGILPSNILIIVDEYNFPVGKIHLKNSGNDGGHNGIASIIEKLGVNNFYRLRCGIGNDFPPGGMVDYVLSVFKTNEIDDLNLMLDKSVEAIQCVLLNGAARAMTLVNSGRLWRVSPNNDNDDKTQIECINKDKQT